MWQKAMHTHIPIASDRDCLQCPHKWSQSPRKVSVSQGSHPNLSAVRDSRSKQSLPLRGNPVHVDCRPTGCTSMVWEKTAAGNHVAQLKPHLPFGAARSQTHVAGYLFASLMVKQYYVARARATAKKVLRAAPSRTLCRCGARQLASQRVEHRGYQLGTRVCVLEAMQRSLEEQHVVMAAAVTSTLSLFQDADASGPCTTERGPQNSLYCASASIQNCETERVVGRRKVCDALSSKGNAHVLRRRRAELCFDGEGGCIKAVNVCDRAAEVGKPGGCASADVARSILHGNVTHPCHLVPVCEPRCLPTCANPRPRGAAMETRRTTASLVA